MADYTPLLVEPDTSALCDFFMAKVALHGCFLPKTDKLTNYEGLLTRFSADFGEWEVSSVTIEEVLTFLRFD